MSKEEVTDLIDAQDEFRSFVQDFRLWPTAWEKIRDLDHLDWVTVKFDESELDSVSEKSGIYSFVINPGVTNHPNRYLCYIGKTKRPLKERIMEYVAEAKSSSGRPAIIRVLNKWSGYIEVSFIEIEQGEINALEKKLNDAFLPPFQKQFSADVNRIINAF